MHTIGMRLSPDTKEMTLIVAGEKHDEFNQYHLEFTKSDLELRRTVTVIMDEGLEVKALTDCFEMLPFGEYQKSNFEFKMDGDLSGPVKIQVVWSTSEIDVIVVKGD